MGLSWALLGCVLLGWTLLLHAATRGLADLLNTPDALVLVVVLSLLAWAIHIGAWGLSHIGRRFAA